MKFNMTSGKAQAMSFLIMVTAMLLLTGNITRANDNFDAWHNSDKWDMAAGAMLSPDNNRRLAGKPGDGVLFNGTDGKRPSLVTKRRDYRDVEVHLEFMVAKGSNSGVIFHGNHEIQILDSYGIEKPTAGHCGGVYPWGENVHRFHQITGTMVIVFGASMALAYI